jgi:DnaJ-class molecular chaperone
MIVTEKVCPDCNGWGEVMAASDIKPGPMPPNPPKCPSCNGTGWVKITEPDKP